MTISARLICLSAGWLATQRKETVNHACLYVRIAIYSYTVYT